MNNRKKHKKRGIAAETETPEATSVDERQTTPPDDGQDGNDAAAPVEAQAARELAEAKDRYLRSKAELENYRRRAQREFSEIRENTKGLTVQEFFSVFDHFQMAMDHVQENPDFNTLKQGMDMILGEFQRTFEALGVQRIDAVHSEFNPNEHEAVSHEPSADVPSGHVLRQWKCGYRMGDRLLRPATVVVSSGPPEQSEDGNE